MRQTDCICPGPEYAVHMARGGLSAAGRQMAMRLLPFTVTLWFCLTAWSTAASMRTRFCVS